LLECERFLINPGGKTEDRTRASSAATAATGQWLGGQTESPARRPDLKEGFYIGEELPEDDLGAVRGLQSGAKNSAPAGVLTGLSPGEDSYFEAMLGAERADSWRGLALSTWICRRTFFAAFLRTALATLRRLHYRPQPAKPLPGEKGCWRALRFWGILSFCWSLTNRAAGLGLRHGDSAGWIGRRPIPGTFVVNLRWTLIARWTN